MPIAAAATVRLKADATYEAALKALRSVERGEHAVSVRIQHGDGDTRNLAIQLPDSPIHSDR